MMRLLAFSSVILLFSFVSISAEKPFPVLEGITLDDEAISIPKDTKGKYTLLGLAYSKKAEDHLNTWAESVYSKFIYKPKTKQLFQTTYDINVFLIPMFTGAKAAIEKQARKHAINHISPSLHHYVLFYKGEGKTYKEELNMDDKHEPYFFLLDEEGQIVYETKGLYSEDKMTEIEDLLTEAGY